MRTVLVTGGAGYIGTHVITVLAAKGHRCVSIDNYSNSSPRALERVSALVPGAVEAWTADIRDAGLIRQLVGRIPIDSVIHLAGLKSVSESVRFPERYQENNVEGTRQLLRALAGSAVRDFVFSSSATVYGLGGTNPLKETSPTEPVSPYGRNKLDIEEMLAACVADDPSWRVANLRYFNPVAAHPSGAIGEDPRGVPNNLMPYVCQVASGRLPRLRIFGGDYPTSDGTAERDFIHVMDLAEGHVAALEAMRSWPRGTVATVNLGTGSSISVLRLVRTFEAVNAVSVPRETVARRAGDIAAYYADASLAQNLLGWRAKRGLEEMCRDAWRWQQRNPAGYLP